MADPLFNLTKRPRAYVAPINAELLAEDLRHAATQILTTDGPAPALSANQRAATLFALAADAYSHAVTASNGHARRARYDTERAWCLAQVAALAATPKENGPFSVFGYFAAEPEPGARPDFAAFAPTRETAEADRDHYREKYSAMKTWRVTPKEPAQ